MDYKLATGKLLSGLQEMARRSESVHVIAGAQSSLVQSTSRPGSARRLPLALALPLPLGRGLALGAALGAALGGPSRSLDRLLDGRLDRRRLALALALGALPLALSCCLGLALGQVADGVSAGKRHLARDELVVGRLGDQELDLHATADLRILRILRQKLFTADVDLLPLLHLGCKEGIRSKSM